MPLISNVRPHEIRMNSLASHCLESNRRMCSFARGTWANLPRAVRPLAASAPAADLEALRGSASAGVSSVLSKKEVAQSSGIQSLCFSQALEEGSTQQGQAIQIRVPAVFRQAMPSQRSQASRMRARQIAVGRAGTSRFAARAGGVRLLASGATQRKLQGRVAPCVRPNPSIERTCPGKPGHASHLKR
jgi:hypothetical protein